MQGRGGIAISADVGMVYLRDASAWLGSYARGVKLASGDLLALAEIVRDGIRHAAQAKKSAAPKLSESEQRLYLQARELLAREIGSARGLDQFEADAWIEGQAAPNHMTE